MEESKQFRSESVSEQSLVVRNNRKGGSSEHRLEAQSEGSSDSEHARLKREVVDYIRHDEHRPRKPQKRKLVFFRKKRNFFSVDGIRVVAQEQVSLKSECRRYSAQTAAFLDKSFPRFLLTLLQRFRVSDATQQTLILSSQAATPGNILFELDRFERFRQGDTHSDCGFVSKNVTLCKPLWTLIESSLGLQASDSACFDRVLVRPVSFDEDGVSVPGRPQSAPLPVTDSLKLCRILRECNFAKCLLLDCFLDLAVLQKKIRDPQLSRLLPEDTGFRFHESSLVDNLLANRKVKADHLGFISEEGGEKVFPGRVLASLRKHISSRMSLLEQKELERIDHILLKREEGFFELIRSGIREYTFIYDLQFIETITRVFRDQWTLTNERLLGRPTANIEKKYAQDFRRKASQLVLARCQSVQLTVNENLREESLPGGVSTQESRKKPGKDEQRKSTRKIKKRDNFARKLNKNSLWFLEDLIQNEPRQDSPEPSEQQLPEKNEEEKDETSGENSGDPETGESPDEALLKKRAQVTRRKMASQKRSSKIEQTELRELENREMRELKSRDFGLVHVASIPHLEHKLKFENVFLEVYNEKPKTMDHVQIMLGDAWCKLAAHVKVF